MSIKLEKVVQTFYEGLEEGKLLGRKCPKCGNVEFPPVYACNACGNYETEWYETVSYTHLDVYKRQGLESGLSLPAAGWWDVKWVFTWQNTAMM